MHDDGNASQDTGTNIESEGTRFSVAIEDLRNSFETTLNYRATMHFSVSTQSAEARRTVSKIADWSLVSSKSDVHHWESRPFKGYEGFVHVYQSLLVS